MTLTKVLEILYGKVTSGYLQATYIENGKCRSKCFQTDQLSEIESFIRKYGKSCNTYIDINPRNREMEYYERGSRGDISTVVGAYQDYDIKGIAHKEENLPLSAEELYAFLKELPVQPTFLVYTGNGVHAYWLFEKPYEIHTESERSYIEHILKGWETHVHQLAMERYGWNFDAVADLPRMLRAPETTNFKTEERPVCKVVSICENYYLPADLEPYCDTKQVSANPVPDADEFALMGTDSAEELVSKCTFLQHCRDNAANISEPYWYAMLSNVSLTANGHEMAHSLSSPYPGYTYQETEKKYRHALEQDKPTTCEFIKNRLCFHCGRSCGVKAPIALVHSKASVQPNWEEPIPFDNFSVPDFPVETLPEAIGTYVSAVAESTQTPVDLAATSAIAIMPNLFQGLQIPKLHRLKGRRFLCIRSESMATTRIIPMHINKRKTIVQCMKARLDYVKNPDKTAGGELVCSYACAPQTADREFLLSRDAYLANTGRHISHEIIAYQLRQSFKPGEVTPEEANKIGYELASRYLNGEHAFIVATHTDRHHIQYGICKGGS